MYVFTPNTLIKSAEVNVNFTEADTRLTKLETPPYYNGDIQNENTATTYKVLGPSRELISGITKTNTSTLTVVTKGIYVIQAQQLISAGANAGYFEIRINNTTETYGYYPGNSFNDVPVSCMKELNVGDTIRIYQTAAVTTTWAGAHSNLSVFCIKRT